MFLNKSPLLIFLKVSNNSTALCDRPSFITGDGFVNLRWKGKCLGFWAMILPPMVFLHTSHLVGNNEITSIPIRGPGPNPKIHGLPGYCHSLTWSPGPTGLSLLVVQWLFSFCRSNGGCSWHRWKVGVLGGRVTTGFPILWSRVLIVTKKCETPSSFKQVLVEMGGVWWVEVGLSVYMLFQVQ